MEVEDSGGVIFVPGLRGDNLIAEIRELIGTEN